MKELYPIIRRVRRPLLPVQEVPRPQIPVAPANEGEVADVPASAEKQNEPVDETPSA